MAHRGRGRCHHLERHFPGDEVRLRPQGDEHGFSSGGSSAPYVAGYLIGAGCLGAGIPLWVKGSKGVHRIADDYNANYGSSLYGSRNSSMTLGPTRSGVGLALNF